MRLKKGKDKKAQRRLDKTSVRDASSEEILDMLASYGPDSSMMRGQYKPEKNEIVMYSDDPDALQHEMIHSTQYGPLRRLAFKMTRGEGVSGRIQDPTKRNAYKDLISSIPTEKFEGLNRAGKFILGEGDGEEFEAVLTTGVNAGKERGVDFTKSFDEIKIQLETAESPTNNMTGLMKFMDNDFTEEQKNLVVSAIRSNL